MVLRAQSTPDRRQLAKGIDRKRIWRLQGLFFVGAFAGLSLGIDGAMASGTLWTGLIGAAVARVYWKEYRRLSRTVEVAEGRFRYEGPEGKASFPLKAVTAHRIDGQQLHLSFEDQPPLILSLDGDDDCTRLLRTIFPPRQVRIAALQEVQDIAEVHAGEEEEREDRIRVAEGQQ